MMLICWVGAKNLQTIGWWLDIQNHQKNPINIREPHQGQQESIVWIHCAAAYPGGFFEGPCQVFAQRPWDVDMSGPICSLLISKSLHDGSGG